MHDMQKQIAFFGNYLFSSKSSSSYTLKSASKGSTWLLNGPYPRGLFILIVPLAGSLVGV